MPAIHGKNTQVLLNEDDLSFTFNKADQDTSVDTAETTTFRGTGWKTFVPGQGASTQMFDGVVDGSVLQELRSEIQTTPGDVLTVAPQGMDVVGNMVRLAQVLTTKLSNSATVGGVVAFSWEVIANGVVAIGRTLAPLIARTTTASGASVDNTVVSTLTGAIAHLHVTAVSGTAPNLVVRVQDSADNAAWATIGTFTAATVPTTQRLVIAGTVRRYTRLDWTITGTTPSFTFAGALART